jgi:DNA-binding transcriptional ArsR family regulator
VPVVPEALLQEAARRFSLLADPTRLRIVSTLHDCGEISVGGLAAQTGIPLASVSQHLNRLAVGGIVGRRREGTSFLYRITDDTIEALCDIVCAGLRQQAEAAQRG